MGRRCDAFYMEDAKAAREHMDFEILQDYGGWACGHSLHTWMTGNGCWPDAGNVGIYTDPEF